MSKQLDYQASDKFDYFNATNELCTNLFEYLPISGFEYCKVSSNGQYIALASSHWPRVFYENQLAGPGYQGNNFESGIYARHNCQEINLTEQTCQIASENFALYDPLFIVKKHDGYYEMFDFYSKDKYLDMVSLYLQNYDIFQHFMRHFVHRAKTLIELAEQNPIHIPRVYDSSFVLKTNHNYRHNYYQSFQHPHLSLLTDREKQCISLLKEGKTYKSIASSLHLSPRTIESHMDNIKMKLGCRTKEQLLEILYQLIV